MEARFAGVKIGTCDTIMGFGTDHGFQYEIFKPSLNIFPKQKKGHYDFLVVDVIKGEITLLRYDVIDNEEEVKKWNMLDFVKDIFNARQTRRQRPEKSRNPYEAQIHGS